MCSFIRSGAHQDIRSSVGSRTNLRRGIVRTAYGQLRARAGRSILAFKLRTVARAGCKQRQMSTGRIADHRDPVLVHSQRFRIGSSPSDRRFDVLDLSGPFGVAGQPILHGNRNITECHKRRDAIAKCILAAGRESSAMPSLRKWIAVGGNVASADPSALKRATPMAFVKVGLFVP